MNRKRSGFTLIELLLAMSFISIMLLAMMACILQIGAIYTRGETLRNVNQSSRTVVDDMKQTLANSASLTLDDVLVRMGDSSETTSGRLCLGEYSYVWNTVDADTATSDPRYNKYTDGSAVNFARVRDVGGQLCAAPTTAVNKSIANELLNSGDRTLRLHSLAITEVLSSGTRQAIYSVTLQLGTDTRQAMIGTADRSCVAPNQANADPNYCAINKISFTARTGIR